VSLLRLIVSKKAILLNHKATHLPACHFTGVVEGVAVALDAREALMLSTLSSDRPKGKEGLTEIMLVVEFVASTMDGFRMAQQASNASIVVFQGIYGSTFSNCIGLGDRLSQW